MGINNSDIRDSRVYLSYYIIHNLEVNVKSLGQIILES